MKRRIIRTLLADMRQALSPRLAVVLLIPLCLPMDTIVDWQWLFSSERLSVFYFYFHAVQFGGLFGRYFTCMFCAIPYAMAFCDEFNSGMSTYAYARSGRRIYFISKFVVAAITGGMVMSVGTILFVAPLTTVLPMTRPEDLLGSLPYLSLLTRGSGWSYYICAAYYAFLSGMLWAGIATAVSAFASNRYAVVAAPLVAFFTIAQTGRALAMVTPYSLDRLLSMRIIIHSPEITFIIVTSIIILILIVCALVFMKKAERKVVYA